MKPAMFSMLVLSLLAGPALAEKKKAEPKKVKFDTLKTQHIVDLLYEIKKSGQTMLVVTHDVHLASGLADWVSVLDAGTNIGDAIAEGLIRLNRAAEAVPLLAGRPPLDGGPAAYVCERFTCKRPTADAAELASQLGLSAT